MLVSVGDVAVVVVAAVVMPCDSKEAGTMEAARSEVVVAGDKDGEEGGGDEGSNIKSANNICRGCTSCVVFNNICCCNSCLCCRRCSLSCASHGCSFRANLAAPSSCLICALHKLSVLRVLDNNKGGAVTLRSLFVPVVVFVYVVVDVDVSIVLVVVKGRKGSSSSSCVRVVQSIAFPISRDGEDRNSTSIFAFLLSE